MWDVLDFSPDQRVFGRQLRLPSSLLEDDFIVPYTIVQDDNHGMQRSEAMRMAAAHGCVIAADRRAMTTAVRSRRRKPQWALVAGEPVFIHRRKDGAQGWCGLGVCVLSEEPKSGRNETVWVHMRNCLHKCSRRQVRPATNEETEGIETVASLLPGLTEAVREGRTRHFADITDEGDLEDDEETVVEGDVMDLRVGRPDSQPELELNVPANPDATSRSTRSETHAEPEAEVSTSIGTDMETGARDRRVRLREEGIDSSRHHLDVHPDRTLTAEARGKNRRRAEASEYGERSRSAEACSSGQLVQATVQLEKDSVRSRKDLRDNTR